MRPNSKEALRRLMILKHVVFHSIATPSKQIRAELFRRWSDDECDKFDNNCRERVESNIAAMRELGLWEYTSPKEKSFLQSYSFQMDEQAHKNASWRMECAGMIMWALSIIDTWPKIDEEISPDLLKMVPIQKIGFFSKHPSLRDHKEISKKRDLIELWHWRVREKGLIDKGFPFEPDANMKKAGFNTLDDIVRFTASQGYKDGELPEIIDEDFVFQGKPFRSLSQDEYERAAGMIMERHYALNWLCGMAPRNRWDETPTET